MVLNTDGALEDFDLKTYVFIMELILHHVLINCVTCSNDRFRIFQKKGVGYLLLSLLFLDFSRFKSGTTVIATEFISGENLPGKLS